MGIINCKGKRGFFSLDKKLLVSCQLLIRSISNIKEVPMVMVLLSYFSRYAAWQTNRLLDSHVTTKIFDIDGLPNFLK